MEFKNRNPLIYVIAGLARNGKDTIASDILNYYSKLGIKGINLQFSSYIKEYAKNISSWDGSDENKPRELLQQLGTELIRNKIDSKMFIKRMIDDIKVYSYFFDVIVVSDARFVDEISTVKDNFSNVFVINVSCKENGLTFEQKNHSTETGLDNYSDYDFVINNDGSKYDLKKKILEVLK